jgi:hypothetical protein
LAVCLVAGCAEKSDDDAAGVQVEAPGVSVEVTEEGTAVEAPGVTVEADETGVEVTAPGVDVEAE